MVSTRHHIAEMYGSAIIALTRLYTYDLDLDLTLKTFSAMPTHMVNVCPELH